MKMTKPGLIMDSIEEMLSKDKPLKKPRQYTTAIWYTQSASKVKGPKDSILKLFQQLKIVAKEPFLINNVCYIPPTSLIVTEAFYRKYGCYLHCGACCPNYSMDYLPVEWLEFVQIYPEHQGKEVIRQYTVNQQEKVIRTFDQTDAQLFYDKEWCRFLEKDTAGCRIHKYNALSCQVELIKILRVKDVGYIRKQGGYGRGWALRKVVDGEPGILCDISTFSEEQFWENDIPVFYRILAWATYFQIETWLPEVIAQLKHAVQIGDFNRVTIY